MALRATATARPPYSPPVSSPSMSPKTTIHTCTSKPQSKPNSLLLSATTALPLFALFAVPLEATAVTLPREQIFSSLNQVESTIEQVVQVGSNIFSVAGQAIGAVVKVVKPGVDATLPILKQAGEEAVKIASPVVSEVSKKAQEAIESTGIDTQPVKTVAKVESTIEQVVQVGSNVFSVAGQAIGAVVKAVKPGVDAALPILKQAGEEAVKIASPVVSEVSKKAQEAIESTGIDTQPVKTVAKTVADAAQQTTQVIGKAQPVAVSTVKTIVSAEPNVILGTGGALVLAYFLLPPIFSAISFKFRGYKGDLSPAQTLDLMCTKNYILIDIRSEKDKNKDGTPRLPSDAKSKLISIPLDDLPGKLRGLVRNTKKVEAELVALKISHLKKVSKNSNIVIMDSYTDSAKIVAKALRSLGFNKCWIMSDGFSGSKGWLQSRLGADTTGLSVAEVISPS